MEASGATMTRPPGAFDEQTDEQKERVEHIRTRYKEMDGVHKQYRDKWDRLDAIYNTFDEKIKGLERDRDPKTGGVLLHTFGTPLHIPIAYATIETVIPRILSAAPNQIAKPLDSDAVEACKPIADLINQQQRNIGYELKLQPAIRRALKFGLGVTRVDWEKRSRKVQIEQPSIDGEGVYEPLDAEYVEYEGPTVEDVDIYDWFWDPNAKSIETCQDVIYRTWRPFSYVKERVDSGAWTGINLEAAENGGSTEKRRDLWSQRLAMQGISDSDYTQRDDRLHEVWEYHEKGRVSIVLDDAFLVADGDSYYAHGRFPFQIFRPTIVEGQLPGKGEIEPLEDLIKELDTIRTQRRDNAAMVINRVLAYSQGFVKKSDIKYGPGVTIPVQGDPREVIFPLPVDDLPASSYNEEIQLKRDVETTSGISEAQSGGSGMGDTAGTETATGMQLVQQAANARIAGKARLMLLEMLRPAAWQMLWLNRQFAKRGGTVRIDDPSHKDGFRFMELRPEILNANVELIPEEHSTEPENRVQRINDAMTLQQMAATNPEVDQRRAFEHVLKEYGIRDTESWFINPNEVPPEAVAEAFRRMLLQGGMSEEEAAQMVLTASEGAIAIAEELRQVEDTGEAPAAAPEGPPQQAPPEPDKGRAYPVGVDR